MIALGALVRRHPDRAARIVLIILPLMWFAPALRPGYTLAPLDNLFTTALARDRTRPRGADPGSW
jgi:hypothetical protein